MADEVVVLRRMSIATDDFLRTLPIAVTLPLVAEAEGRAVFAAPGDRANFAATGDWVLTIRYRAVEPLRLGALILPVLAVELAFARFAGEEREIVLAHFDKMYRRGGG